MIPVMSVITALLSFLLAFLVVPFERFEFSLLFVLVGLILGAFWGAYISRNSVKRSRLRSGFSSTCYRCSRCQKVFDYKTPLNN